MEIRNICKHLIQYCRISEQNESKTIVLSIPRIGICEPARHSIPGDVRQERHQRRAGIHDDGSGDQESRRAAVERRGSTQCRQDRQKPQRRVQVRLLLNSFTFVVLSFSCIFPPNKK